MRNLAIMIVMVLSFFSLLGCPLPDSYIRSTELGLENSKNLDSNITIFATNYYSFISKDTEQLVAEKMMEESARQEVLKNVEEQMANMKIQSSINKRVMNLCYDQAHDKTLTIEEVVAGIQTINKVTPEILEFLEKMKGGE